MNRSFIAVLIALFGFSAGFFVCRWAERYRPVPPPPASLLTEFRPKGEAPPPSRWNRPVNRSELIAQIESLKPQLEEFQRRLDEIDAKFERDIEPFLNAEQSARHAEFLKRRNAPRSSRDENKPISDDELTFLLHEQPGRTVVGDVVIPLRLDVLTNRYKLDNDQREKVRVLLRARREAFLALVDAAPPPSVLLVRLAPLVQRIGEAAPPPPKPPQAP
jgi:hypothetical protein